MKLGWGCCSAGKNLMPPEELTLDGIGGRTASLCGVKDFRWLSNHSHQDELRAVGTQEWGRSAAELSSFGAGELSFVQKIRTGSSSTSNLTVFAQRAVLEGAATGYLTGSNTEGAAW